MGKRRNNHPNHVAPQWQDNEAFSPDCGKALAWSPSELGRGQRRPYGNLSRARFGPPRRPPKRERRRLLGRKRRRRGTGRQPAP